MYINENVGNVIDLMKRSNSETTYKILTFTVSRCEMTSLRKQSITKKGIPILNSFKVLTYPTLVC